MKQPGSGRTLLFILVALSVARVSGQEWQADLPVVEEAGIYWIALSPEIIGRSKQHLEDIRLVDEMGVSTPYILKTNEMTSMRDAPHSFRITRNEVVHKQTIVEVERPVEKFVVDDVHFQFRNAIVTKEVTVTGSDNGTEWFFIKEDRIVLGEHETDRTTSHRVLRLPTSDYKNYRFVFNDSTTAPVQVLDASWISLDLLHGAYVEDTTAVWSVHDSANTSVIAVRSSYPMHIDRIAFTVSGGGEFRRVAHVVRPWWTATGKGARKRKVRREETTMSFVLDPESAGRIDIVGFRRGDTFSIVIENGDDRPLKITDVQFLQLQRYLIAELRPSVRYSLTTGDPGKRAPQYDIVHFKDELPEPIATMTHGALRALPTSSDAGPAVDLSRWWIWAGLVVVLGIVGFMAVRMLREPEQQNS